MESKTLLLDLVQQRKDGRITQEEMVRQLVELRNQVRVQHTTLQAIRGGRISPQSASSFAVRPSRLWRLPLPLPLAADLSADARSVAPHALRCLCLCLFVPLVQPVGSSDVSAPQDGATPAVPVATAPTPGGGADQRASIQADIERQREERLAAKQQGGGSAARQAWGGAPAPAPAAPATGRDAAVVAKSYCSAVSAHHRDGRSAFDAYDTSRSGVISFEDLRRGVRSDPSTSRSALTDTDVSEPLPHTHTMRAYACTPRCAADHSCSPVTCCLPPF